MEVRGNLYNREGKFVGGYSNVATGTTATFIGGGGGNALTSSNYTSIGGGKDNTITNSSTYSSIFGGINGTITSSPNSSIINSGGATIDNTFSATIIGDKKWGSENNSMFSGFSSAYGGAIIAGVSLIDGTNTPHGFGGGNVTIGGWYNRIQDSQYSQIIGGTYSHVNASVHSTILAGKGSSGSTNVILNGYNSFIIGVGNTITSSSGTTVIGTSNSAINANNSIIGGGGGNSITNSNKSSIGGGDTNKIISSGNTSSIVGGDTNTINNSNNSTIGGGENNSILAPKNGFIGGGKSNQIFGGTGYGGNGSSIVGGGGGESIGNYINFANYAFIGGGSSNSITYVTATEYSHYSSVVGGVNNTISDSKYSSIIGGGKLPSGASGNTITDSDNSIIGAGISNAIQNLNSSYLNDGASVIVGGLTNVIDGSVASIIGGGTGNDMDSTSNYSAYNGIVGGKDNRIGGYSNYGSVIGGGRDNTIYGVNFGATKYTNILGGRDNNIYNLKGSPFNILSYSSVLGGRFNTLQSTSTAYGANNSTIVGGLSNILDDSKFSAILGGQENYMSDITDSFIIGSNITATTSNTTYVNKLKFSDSGSTFISDINSNLDIGVTNDPINGDLFKIYFGTSYFGIRNTGSTNSVESLFLGNDTLGDIVEVNNSGMTTTSLHVNGTILGNSNRVLSDALPTDTATIELDTYPLSDGAYKTLQAGNTNIILNATTAEDLTYSTKWSLEFTQDATTGRTLTLGVGFLTPGGTTPEVSSTTGATDTLYFETDSNGKHRLIEHRQNYL